MPFHPHHHPGADSAALEVGTGTAEWIVVALSCLCRTREARVCVIMCVGGIYTAVMGILHDHMRWSAPGPDEAFLPESRSWKVVSVFDTRQCHNTLRPVTL